MLTAQVASVALVNVIALTATEAHPSSPTVTPCEQMARTAAGVAQLTRPLGSRYRIAAALSRDAEDAAAVLSDVRPRTARSEAARLRSVQIYLRRLGYMAAVLRGQALRRNDAEAATVAKRVALKLVMIRTAASRFQRHEPIAGRWMNRRVW